MPERYDQPPPPPPPDDYHAPQPRYRAPSAPKVALGPNQIPKFLSILIIVGVILMFVGMVFLNATYPTKPEPDRPLEADPRLEDYDPSSDEYEDYENEMDEWEHDIENSKNKRAQTFQIGSIIHNLGVLLISLPLLIAGLFLNDLDMGMRKTLIIMGTILLLVMFIVPFSWMWTGGLAP